MSTTRASVNVLGVTVSRWTPEELVQAMVRSARNAPADPGGAPLRTVLYANVHVLNTAYRTPELRRELEGASCVYCDGVGVSMAGRFLAGSRLPRLTAADWLPLFCRSVASAEIPIFLLGGAPWVAEETAKRLRADHPRLQITGSHHGYLTEEDNRRLVAEINESGARILLVGMGTPRQELWIKQHRASLDVPVVWAVGALMDFVAGVQRRAPRWMLRANLEWLWRLMTDPRRLAGRYLVGNPLFCLRVARQRLSGPADKPEDVRD